MAGYCVCFVADEKKKKMVLGVHVSIVFGILLTVGVTAVIVVQVRRCRRRRASFVAESSNFVTYFNTENFTVISNYLLDSCCKQYQHSANKPYC
jgi:hypothetical protein